MAKCFFVNGTASWYGPDLTCLPIGTCIHSTCHVPRASPATCPDCGRPQEILHGLTTAQHSCTSYRCEMTYSCQPGFQVSHAPSPAQPSPCHVCRWWAGPRASARLTARGPAGTCPRVSRSSATSPTTQSTVSTSSQESRA